MSRAPSEVTPLLPHLETPSRCYHSAEKQFTPSVSTLYFFSIRSLIRPPLVVTLLLVTQPLSFLFYLDRGFILDVHDE